MNKENWEWEADDVACYENDANDFYYEWVDLKENNLVGLFSKWLGVSISHNVKIKIKAGKGILFFQKVGYEE